MSSAQNVPVPLPSGRTVVIHSAGRREEIEIRSATGEMEVRIALTDQGPVLSLRGARLEIDSSDTVAVKCRNFELQTSEGLQLQSGGDVGIRSQGDVHVQSSGDTHLDGELVKLNCKDRTGYHDAAVPTLPPPAAE
jgi:hypothetical protein